MLRTRLGRGQAALGAAGLVACIWVLHRVRTTPPGDDVQFGQTEWLILAAFALAVWLVHPHLAAFKHARRLRQSLLRPRAGWPGRRGVPEEAALRFELTRALTTPMLRARRADAPPPPDMLARAFLINRLQEYDPKAPDPIRQLDGLKTGQVFELWALHQALTAEGAAVKPALARLKTTKRVKAARRAIAEARAETERDERESAAFRAAMQSWEQDGAVKLGPTGLKGFLQRNAPRDPALWHQVLCGIESDAEHDTVAWILKQPEVNPGGFAIWLAQATTLGYVRDMVLRAETRGDAAFLQVVGAAIARWCAGAVGGALWDHPDESWATPENGDRNGIEQDWERQMAEVEAILGHRPWGNPVRLLSAPMVAPPAPCVAYRYAHGYGLTVAPPRREDFSTAA
ncbi:MAG: hypothetical protein AAF865_08565 [Pseudomonadota bacterium]